ncbi:14509_t:CDS:2, partial [Acaulospora colombiana]
MLQPSERERKQSTTHAKSFICYNDWVNGYNKSSEPKQTKPQVPLGDPNTMNYNTTETEADLLSNRCPAGFTRGGNEVLAEPLIDAVIEAPGCERIQPQESQANEIYTQDRGWDNILELEDMDILQIDLEETINDNTDESETDSLFEDEQDMQTRQAPQKSLKPRNSMIKGPIPGIKIGSLNVRGRRTTSVEQRTKDKFQMISKWIKTNEMTITALVDTHWDEEYVKSLKVKHKQIFCSHETTHRGGIAFIIDTKKWKPKESKFTTLIEGRSGMLDIEYDQQRLKIVAIYVPPDRKEKIEILRALRKKLRNEIEKENLIIMGDFNLVEEDMDREPCHPDDRETVNELTKLKAELNLIDGWRNANPEERAYTWSGKNRNDHSFARIDRIYIEDSLTERANEWRIEPTESKLSDHSGVTVKILDPEPPFIGAGEWRLPLNIIEHPHFRKKTTEALEKLERQLGYYMNGLNKTKKNHRKIESLRKTINPQESWQSYKEVIRTAAQEAQQIRRKHITKERRQLDRELRALQRKPTPYMDENELKDIRSKMHVTEKKIKDLTEEHNTRADASIAARWFKEDEKGSKLWYSLNKERPKRQIFYSLFKKGAEETRNTEEMMEIARAHHELSKTETHNLKSGISYMEVEDTIRESQTGKAPGCDGIPNEFWKHELERYKKSKETGNRRPSIIMLMKIVLTDIDIHGPINERFAEGRMSLLYKKKDIRDIENYQPITLLNTDYKIYTTILTGKLKAVAPSIINLDQAGFMPKRSIYDQTKLLELIIKLSENRRANGMVMALDQEKAYDRIDHTYLWATMKAFGIPKCFIRRVRKLYENAGTSIRLNGCTTNPFKVDRGVRQGDPLSCLLYNIAIEPLFELIRTSGLKGIYINKDTFNALVMAYADDTTVYLCETDKLEILEECIELFCKASTAKFNKSKTEVIPVGDPEYRKKLIESRTFNGKRIENNIKIAKDGEPVRILGSWQGNKVNAEHKWSEIMEKQLKIMKLWASSFPTTIARSRIAKQLVVSRALYLMTVNGISRENLETMERNIRSFIWGGKKGSIAWERAIRNKKEGGIGAPSVKLVYEATKVMWLKRWLTPGNMRPKWSFAANEILTNARQNNPMVDERCITEWVEQSWKSKIKIEEVPGSLRDMIKVARKHNLKISILRAPMALKLNMPAFFHPGNESNRKNNTQRAKCLRKNHAIYT